MNEKIVEMSKSQADAYFAKLKREQPNGLVSYKLFGGHPNPNYISVCDNCVTVHVKVV